MRVPQLVRETCARSHRALLHKVNVSLKTGLTCFAAILAAEVTVVLLAPQRVDGRVKRDGRVNLLPSSLGDGGASLRGEH